MIDNKRKLLFVHIARTGGTSIETALVGEDWHKVDKETKHLSAAQARKLYGEDIWNTYTTFSVVRNPWDRVISMWKSKWWHQSIPKRGSIESRDLEKFIAQLKPHRNDKAGTVICAETLDVDLDYILRFENLQTEFSNMLEEKGLDDIKLPHLLKRKRVEYPTYYNKKTKQMAADLFHKDITRFGYKF